MISSEEKIERQRRVKASVERAKVVIKKGDRLRVTKCPGTKRWITFDHWDGDWMVSKSGIDDYSPFCVDMINNEHVDFTSSEASK